MISVFYLRFLALPTSSARSNWDRESKSRFQLSQPLSRLMCLSFFEHHSVALHPHLSQSIFSNIRKPLYQNLNLSLFVYHCIDIRLESAAAGYCDFNIHHHRKFFFMSLLRLLVLTHRTFRSRLFLFWLLRLAFNNSRSLAQRRSEFGLVILGVIGLRVVPLIRRVVTL